MTLEPSTTKLYSLETEQSVIGDCGLCVASSSIYNWANICCRARFVVGLPLKWLRRGWLDRWKQSEPEDFCHAIENEVISRWASRAIVGGIKNDGTKYS